MNKSSLIILLLFLVVGSQAFAEELKITFFDVGEGDSALIECDQSHSILIDTGTPLYSSKLIGKLKGFKLGSDIDLILTHPHLDHVGGVFALLDNFKFRNVYDNAEELKGISVKEDMYRWYQDAVRKNPAYKRLIRGDKIECGFGVIDVLWPKSMYGDWNTNSIALKLTAGKFQALLMGDGNLATEQGLLKTQEKLKSTLIKAGHHGASDTGSQEFILAVSPEVVVVSVRSQDIHGYPSAETLKRYRSTAPQVLLTKDVGDIHVSVSSDGYSVNTEKTRN